MALATLSKRTSTRAVSENRERDQICSHAAVARGIRPSYRSMVGNNVRGWFHPVHVSGALQCFLGRILIRCSSVRFALGAGSQSVQASIRANEVQAGSFARLQNYTRRPQFGSHRTRVDELEYATGRTA